jgi:hypothetical protein
LDPLGWGDLALNSHVPRVFILKKKQFQDVQVPRPDMFISQASNSCFFVFFFGSGVSSMSSRTVGAQSGPLRFGGGPSQKMVIEAFADPILLLNHGFRV